MVVSVTGKMVIVDKVGRVLSIQTEDMIHPNQYIQIQSAKTNILALGKQSFAIMGS